jgi:hypothetical protein
MSTHYIVVLEETGNNLYEVDSESGNNIAQKIMYEDGIVFTYVYVSPKPFDSILEYGDPDGYKTNTKLFCGKIYEITRWFEEHINEEFASVENILDCCSDDLDLPDMIPEWLSDTATKFLLNGEV